MSTFGDVNTFSISIADSTQIAAITCKHHRCTHDQCPYVTVMRLRICDMVPVLAVVFIILQLFYKPRLKLQPPEDLVSSPHKYSVKGGEMIYFNYRYTNIAYRDIQIYLQMKR